MDINNNYNIIDLFNIQSKNNIGFPISFSKSMNDCNEIYKYNVIIKNKEYKCKTRDDIEKLLNCSESRVRTIMKNQNSNKYGIKIIKL